MMAPNVCLMTQVITVNVIDNSGIISSLATSLCQLHQETEQKHPYVF